jgi:TfoX N-terminal domain
MVKKRATSKKPAKGVTKSPASRPKMARSPNGLVAMFESAMKDYPDVELRKVFGYPCGFVNGYMTVGLHAADFFVRLPPDEKEILLKAPGGGYLEAMPGRPMRDYVVVPEGVREKKAKLKQWIGKAIQYSQSLPPKEKKARK